MLPEQYKTILHPAFKEFFALVTRSYFNAFMEMSSDIKIPLKPIVFLIIFFITFLENVATFIGSILEYTIWAVIANFAEDNLNG